MRLRDNGIAAGIRGRESKVAGLNTPRSSTCNQLRSDTLASLFNSLSSYCRANLSQYAGNYYNLPPPPAQNLSVLFAPASSSLSPPHRKASRHSNETAMHHFTRHYV
jgi:hypothetical protein